MGNTMLTVEEFYQRQALPLRIKLLLTNQRIRDWVDEYGEENVCVLMSMSPESLALLHIVNSEYPNVKVRFTYSDLKPMLAWMASEDENDIKDWVQNGCNHFEAKNPISRPMAFWTKDNVLEYMRNNQL